MEKLALLYEGKAKAVYETADPECVIIYFRDSATAQNGLKQGTIADKGLLNNLISAHFFALLAAHGVETHYVQTVSPREMLAKKLEIFKVEVVVRNIVAGSLVKRLGYPEGTPLATPILEYYYKDDSLGDPLVNSDHLAALNLATAEELTAIALVSHKVNSILKSHLAEKNLLLVDCKLEFGRHKGRLLLGDEISPDTCRFWDITTHEKLDKDRFRRDLGGVSEAYHEILRRLTGGRLSVQS